MKLALATKAILPMIAVTTRDTVNFPEVLAHVSGKKVTAWNPAKADPFKTGGLYFWICPKGFAARLPLEQIYEQCLNAGCTLVVANVNQMEPVFFDAGEVEVPKDMLFNALNDIVEDKKLANALSRSLGGVTLKEANELASLTMADAGKLTPDAIMATRKGFFQASRGFTQIDTAQQYYHPSEELSAWVEEEGGYFLTGNDFRLRARGVLFEGVPGTGKTSGAKWIAHKLGVPLFRLDIASAKNKYVGESEQNLAAALSRLDNEEPCVVLIDEIEKIFASSSSTSDAGTTTGMLSQILWWLQEHKSRVLTIMTTNKVKALPPELHRPGRIDKRITTNGLVEADAKVFAKRLVTTFGELKGEIPSVEINGIVKRAFQEATIPDTVPKEVPHADVTEQVHKFVKHKITVSKGLSDIFNIK